MSPLRAPSRAAACRFEISPLRRGDEASILRLFERTFGRRKSAEHWRWQFVEPGIEPHVMVARDELGEVVAHFGGMPRRFEVAGARRIFSVAVDSMVAPELRVGLHRTSLFREVVERWVEHFGRGRRLDVGYGLPNREAYRLGRRVLGYTPLEDAIVRVREVGAPWPAVGASEPEVTVASAPEPDHDDLWTRGARTRGGALATAVRDRAFWTRRFAERPGGGYVFVAARRRGALAAAAVFAPHYSEPDCASLADVVWEGADDAALAACLRRAEALAAAAGKRFLAGLFPAESREAGLVAQLGFRAIPTGMPLVARSFDPALALTSLIGRVAYSLADFDID